MRCWAARSRQSLSSAIALALNTSLAFQFRRHIRWKLVLLPAVAYALASVTAIRLMGGPRVLERLNAQVLKRIIYVFVGLSGLLTILRQL